MSTDFSNVTAQQWYDAAPDHIKRQLRLVTNDAQPSQSGGYIINGRGSYQTEAPLPLPVMNFDDQAFVSQRPQGGVGSPDGLNTFGNAFPAQAQQRQPQSQQSAGPSYFGIQNQQGRPSWETEAPLPPPTMNFDAREQFAEQG